jgi:TonB family protein
MPITQIPFQDPIAPPEKPQPEQLGLYDVRDWETAYRDMDDRVPHLLIQLQDDLARSRKREAFWISVIVHILLLIVVFKFDFIQQYIPWHRVVAVPVSSNHDKNVTFLTLPPDAQKLAKKPNTNILSDKDRIATSRHPELDPKELRKMLATPPLGRPGTSGPPMAQPAPAQPPVTAQGQQLQQGGQQQTARPQFDSNQTAQLQAPARPNSKNVFSKYAAGMSAGTAIQQAAQAAAANRGGGGGQEGDFGLGTGAKGRQYGALDILSDTQGVDFGPYLQRVLQEVRENWYRLIPESAQMGKKGKLAIEFAITRDGRIADMRLMATSNDSALDRAAWGGITASNPFPPLPGEFTGPYLSLRFRFYYNPDKSDLE